MSNSSLSGKRNGGIPQGPQKLSCDIRTIFSKLSLGAPKPKKVVINEEVRPEESGSDPIVHRRKRLESNAYRAMRDKLLGNSQRSRVTSSERLLLDTLSYMPTNMPPGAVKRVLRPSSATAKLQSHPSYATTSLFDGNSRPSTAAPALQRPKTQGGARQWARTPQPKQEDVLIKPQRRLTVAEVDGIAEVSHNQRASVAQPQLGALFKGKIEEKIGIDCLDKLKHAFESADSDGTGKLTLAEFKHLLKAQLNLPTSKEGQINALFQKIDWSSDGAIAWDEFCTYMQLEYAEKEDSYLRAKEVSFHLPAKTKNTPHREPVLRISDTADGTFMACSQDGLVSFWTPNLTMKRQRTVQTTENPTQKSQKAKWITDFTIMAQFNKLIVGTGDREIQFFELSSFEPYCQINSLETVPLKLDYCSTGPDECLILFGDSDGCINIIVITSAGECLRTWKKAPKADGIASVGIDIIASGDKTQFIRWKVHDDWVQHLKYYHDIRQVISCSNHANTALVIGCTLGSTDVSQQLREIKDQTYGPGGKDAGKDAANKTKDSKDREKEKLKNMQQWMAAKPRLAADQSVFYVYKGVKCFNFCKEKNVLVTGGMDRIVRIWNPYVSSKPIGMLRGHMAPIFYLFIAAEENRIFSISMDKCIKVWDGQDQNCLLTIRPKGHKIRGDLQACHYSNVTKTLCVATDQMNALPLKLKPVLHADIPITHKEPIHAVAFNPHFKQVITCSDGSTIKIWDFETGNAIFEYGGAHGEHAITCMTFDNKGRRLITGGRDGCVKVWNYNNGQCLRTMEREDTDAEVCALTFVEMNKNRYVVSVGWDKHISIFTDSQDNSLHHIQRPLDRWHDDVRDGHVEDILSVAQCAPNLLATSSYDGEVIVWNMVSGHIFCHLRTPAPEGYHDQALDGDLSINKVAFIKTRVYQKEAACLVSSGPRGHVCLWNVYHGGKLMATFLGSRNKGAMITAMDVNNSCDLLFTADNYGFMYVWNIDGYCLEDSEDYPPEMVTTWRAHVDNVTNMSLIEEQTMLLTSSLDCTVRLWTFDGHYIGTFGQPDAWDVYQPTTFQHPMVPYDVLVDPLSLPDHPCIQDAHKAQDIIHEDSVNNSDDENETSSPEQTTPSLSSYAGGLKQQQEFYVDDQTIAEQLKERPYASGKGKRLRHEKMRPEKIDRGGPSEYQMLRCFDLEPTPEPAAPKLTMNKNDPFSFVEAEAAEA